MKKLLLVLALSIFSLISYSQEEDNQITESKPIDTLKLPIDSITKLITYTEVIKVDSSTNKSELYSRAREWFAKAYNSSVNVIQMDDKESGKIVGKSLVKVYAKALGITTHQGYINYTITIYLKDGRYKYEISNFYHTGMMTSSGQRIEDYGFCEEMIHTKKKSWGFSYQKSFNGFLTQLEIQMKSLIDDLKTSMAKTNNKKNDW